MFSLRATRAAFSALSRSTISARALSTPAPRSGKERVDWALRHTTPGVSRISQIEVESGRGSWVFTTEGEKYLDFTCGIGVTNLGHSHPKIVKALHEQVDKIQHAQVNISFSKPMLDLVEQMIPLVPKGLDRFFFVNSGSEAVESAIKLARHATGKKNVIAFNGSFHGRTYGALALTSSKTIYGKEFGPYVAGVTFSPYAFCHHCPVNAALNGGDTKADVVSRNDCKGHNPDFKCCNEPLNQLELAFKQLTAPEDTAAIILEPVLGEGGYVVPPKSFMKGIRDLCTKHNILMIVDEVQSGFGRTGKQWAFEHFDVEPDVIIFAKGVANGLPLSGLAARPHLMEKQPGGSMGGTYSGNVLACASAIATIKAIKEEEILKNVNQRGDQLKSGLVNISNKHTGLISDIRGLGLMISVEFDQKKVSPGFASKVANECIKNGMLILTTSVFEVIRMIPPLNVSESEVETALRIFDDAVKTVSSQ